MKTAAVTVMSRNPPGGPGQTQAPTIFMQGPPIERKELFHGRSSHVTELGLHLMGGLLGFVGLGLMAWLWWTGSCSNTLAFT